MGSQPAQFCPQCGTQIQAGQRFCTNCGAVMDEDAGHPTRTARTPQELPPGRPDPGQPILSVPTGYAAQTPSPGADNSIYPASTEAAPPPPPPIYNPYSAATSPQSYAPAGPAPTYAAPPPALTPAQVPAYAQKPRKGHGCLTASIILLIVLAAGIGGSIWLIRSRGNPTTNGNTPQSTATSSSGAPTGTGQGNTPVSSGNSSEQLNLKITYAGVNITIVSAQIANSFPGDNTSPGTAGIVRINLQENNTTAGNPNYLLSDSLLLVLPDGNTARWGYGENDIGPAAGVSRSNWVDFPLNTRAALNRLVLRVGTPKENQIDVPLQPGANLSKYQDKISNPNAQFLYAGVNWTLKTATLSYSYNDQQATTGNLYVILGLAAVNNTSNNFINGPSSYLRLQAGTNSTQPDGNTTFPVEVSAHATASGVVAFLVPQGITSFTLVLLAQPDVSPPVNQATQNFQIS